MKLIIFDLDQTLADFIAVYDGVTLRLFSEYFGVDARLTEMYPTYLETARFQAEKGA
jgi:beta-phosphoglucomutase-like phosphatase (HAD superfamily)